jgi:TolB-like protein
MSVSKKALALAALCVAAAQAFAAVAPSVIVLDFAGEGLSKAESAGLREKFESALAAGGAFTVKPRSDAEKALKGSGLSLAGISDPDTAAKVAKKVGATYAIIGIASSGAAKAVTLLLVEAATASVSHVAVMSGADAGELGKAVAAAASEFAEYRERKEAVARGGVSATTSTAARDSADKDKSGAAGATTSGAYDEPLETSKEYDSLGYALTEEEPSVGSPATGASGSSATKGTRTGSGTSGLRAGYADDNEQFNLFLKFLSDFTYVRHRMIAVDERIAVAVVDAVGKPVPNALVEVYALEGQSSGKRVDYGLSYSDGVFYVYPAMYPSARYRVSARSAGAEARAELARNGARSVELALSTTRKAPAIVTLDVAFVLDTTGSMGEEIESLKASIDLINANLMTLKPRPIIRFALVLYKDKGDEYVTRRTDFTSDVGLFAAELSSAYASGGGDGPEDLEAALKETIEGLSWSPDALRAAFVITDAQAHLDYADGYTYLDACMGARRRGVKIYSVGTGGLDAEGEYQLRQIAQLTQARYIFLTYGERGDSDGGSVASVSHHVGSNFAADRLEVIVVRFLKDEYARWAAQAVEIDESYLEAVRIDSETRDQTVAKLFDAAIQDLLAMSTIRVSSETRCSVLPISVAGGAKGLEGTAEYFSTNLLLAATRSKSFVVIDRKDLQKVLEELELGVSGLVDEASAAKVGKAYGAEVLIVGELYRRSDRLDLFLKLVRVETAEVLALAAVRIDPKLGL